MKAEYQPSPWIDEKRLLECVHCGLCLPSCPTHVISGEEMPSPRGRLYLMRAANEGRLELSDSAFHEHEWTCLVCRACETACPSGVQFGYLMEQTREMPRKHEKSSAVKRYVYTKLLGNRKRLNQLQRLVAVTSSLGLAPMVRSLGRMISRSAPKLGAAMMLMPSPVPSPKTRPHAYCQLGSRQGRVGLLLGCVGEAFTSRINDATIRVLNRLGYEVLIIPNVTCCGALQIHAGYREEALGLAKHLVTEVAKANPDFFVSNIAGCGAMLKDYEELLQGTPQESAAHHFRSTTRDISEFLLEKASNRFAKLKSRRPIVVAYHAACHLYHAQKLGELPMQLLGQIGNVTVVPLPENDLCCGSAGSYNIEHPVASEELLKRKLAGISATTPDIIVTANAGCLMQLQKGLRESKSRTPVLHVIELLDQIMQEE